MTIRGSSVGSVSSQCQRTIERDCSFLGSKSNVDVPLVSESENDMKVSISNEFQSLLKLTRRADGRFRR